MPADINKVTETVVCAELDKPITTEIPQSGNKDIVKHVEDYPYDPIDKINKKKEIWRLGVIIDDKWIVFKGEAEESLQIVIRDIKGNNIQATIMEKDIEYWKPKLAEGKTYCMRNFKIYDNNTGFRMSVHKYKLMFVGATRVDELEIAGIPPTLYNFVDFTEILAGKFTPDLLVDAIGVIDSIKKVVTASNTKKGNVAFTIKDMRDNVLDCTLWDSHAIHFLNHYDQQADLGPVVMIIKHAKVKPAQEMYPIQLTNAWYGTKMLFDKEIPEITAFITSLPKDRSYPTQSYRVSNSSQWFSQTSGGSQYNADEIFMKGARILPIAEIKKLKRVSNQGWFFRGCHDCSFKADELVAKIEEQLPGAESSLKAIESSMEDVVALNDSTPIQIFDQTDIEKFASLDDSILSTFLGHPTKHLPRGALRRTLQLIIPILRLSSHQPVGNPLTHTDGYPSFHSLSTKPELAVSFDVVLSKYTAFSSQLTLKKEFGDYIRSTGWNYVLLCNKDFHVQQASILLRGHPKLSSKIGTGWKNFCIREGYKDGDTIRFKFAKSQSENLVHVRKVSSNA
ncbi:hypothetical protein TSUD_377620 [Trifolium subterraneum]|uniref:TF-B3 domain-containing protein n=1 Tax=Trifolium subterraneum TaxID=3900 RepID=A0A2Z6P6N9_TRISU|nr:hypothetical protein TSUD_377620 [Trifolium subterraneum]